MKSWNKIYLFIICAFIYGCVAQSDRTIFYPKDSLEVISVEPAKCGGLATGQKLNITVFYELNAHKKAMVWARPYINDKLAGGYNAHSIIPVAKKDGNPGIITCWFYFDKPAKIDEARIFMRDSETGEIIKAISHKINAKWTGQLE